MSGIHEQFVVEARELIHQATEDLIALEREGVAVERVDRVFRAFHTLKGGAGVVELPAMSLTLHAAEDLLGAIQAGRLRPTSAVVDQVLACLDQVSHWVDAFESRKSLPLHAGEDARAMAERLRGLLPKSGSAEPMNPERTSSVVGVVGVLPDWALRLIESRHGEISGRVPEGATELFGVSYEPRAGCFFDGEDPLQLMRQVPNLLTFHIAAREPWTSLTDMDPYACNLRLQAISAGCRAELSGIFRLVPDQIRIVDIPLEALRQARSLRADDGNSVGLARAVIDEQRRMLLASRQSEEFAGRVGSAARVAANVLRHERRADLADEIGRAGAVAISQGDVAPLLLALDEGIESLVPSPLGAYGQEAAAVTAAGSKADDAERAGRSLRVDESKIDALVNLAGELIVIKNSVGHLAKRMEADMGAREYSRAARQEYSALERLAGEMHAAILQLRMVPIAEAFRSFPRLVRDLSQRLGKKVELVIRGETTASDKTIVDRLFEPMLHLVRNSIDHGIESPEQRVAMGKSETATTTLQASRAGDRFIVEVIDDGGGIDPAIVRRRAGERGLLGGDELAALSDEQAIDLIFSAGFSTTTEVSDISGRGVGMDAVRTTVEQLAGKVSVTSRVGAGTTVRLDLPINIAMSRIMVVETRGQVFGIPMDVVTETVHLTSDRISQFKNNQGFVLRDRVVPICPLAELMRLPGKPEFKSDARLLVVTEIGGKVAALEVDAIRDQLEVVLKPMQGLLANARGYSGTTLLGNGGVLLVLDLKEILP